MEVSALLYSFYMKICFLQSLDKFGGGWMDAVEKNLRM